MEHVGASGATKKLSFKKCVQIRLVVGLDAEEEKRLKNQEGFVADSSVVSSERRRIRPKSSGYFPVLSE